MTRLGSQTAVLVFSVVALAVAGGASSQRAANAASCGSTGTPTTVVYLPNITKSLGGSNGWVTPFIVQNVGALTTRLEVSFYDFATGSLVTCRTISGLAPGTSYADVPNNDADLPGNSQFSVVVRSFGSQVVSVVNQHQGTGARAEALSYTGLTAGTRFAWLPYVVKDKDGWLSTIVMQNVSGWTDTIQIDFQSLDGTKSARLFRTVEPGRSAVIDPRVEPTLAGGTEYSATLFSFANIAGIVNVHNDAPAVAAPRAFSYNALNFTAPSIYVPSVLRNSDGGRTTRVVVQNVPLSDGMSLQGMPVLRFERAGSDPVVITAPSALESGASWIFDPRFAADGRTPCPAAGTASCLGEGEWSLVVSGGHFAALAITETLTNAFGYVGQSHPLARSYLPNITRTLGGASGWTTPIVIQSAGATAATLRWYRFSDGVLVATSQASGLNDGSSLRVDPRSVPGLADDTQYAVTIEGIGGPVAALVLEFAFQGGDGAMAYEAFPSPVASGAISATIDDLAAGCPTAAEVASVRADLDVTVEDDPTGPALVCTAAAGSADLTGLERNIYKSILLMKKIQFDQPLPWTGGRDLYRWFTASVEGIRLRTDISLSFCCDPADTINLAVGGTDDTETNDGFIKLGVRSGTFASGGWMPVLVHEAQHANGPGHNCGLWEERLGRRGDVIGDDLTLSEMGAWATQYYLFLWLADRTNPAFLTGPDVSQGTYQAFLRNEAQWIRFARICTPD